MVEAGKSLNMMIYEGTMHSSLQVERENQAVIN